MNDYARRPPAIEGAILYRQLGFSSGRASLRSLRGRDIVDSRIGTGRRFYGAISLSHFAHGGIDARRI